MDFKSYAEGYLTKLITGVEALDLHKISEAVELIRSCTGTVWLIGNGGSAALASHMATDFQLAGIRAVALTDVAAVTTYANDFGYEHSFSSQFGRLAKPRDILIAISGSGNSPNIVKAALFASGQEVSLITITGFNGGHLSDIRPALNIHVPVMHMGVAQDLHQTILHLITYYLMEGRK